VDVYHVRSPHLLIQAAGYLKHTAGLAGFFGIYFRGQSTLYGDSLIPSLYRGYKTPGGMAGINGILYKYLEQFRKTSKVLNIVPEWAWEATLQHYGIRTRWLDVVDNIWIALWFACQDVHTTGRQGEFLHFEQRQTRSTDDFAYILLIKAEYTSNSVNPGLYGGPTTQLIDLRVAAPSIFLRPHAQTGLLVRRKGDPHGIIADYKDLVAGIIRVSLSDALDWLGHGVLLSTHVLFPPPVYDFGYRGLLRYAPPPPPKLGAIQHIGA
jgi:hypothetical protein